ncbi:hypothetical protein HQO26_23905 [Rhodococcus fascians]|nr:hypothetical protein [Rhodococcus fascians]MBY4419299.1 hypothetical protein [Rhodococcus fascians]
MPRPSPLRVALALDRRHPHSTKLEADSAALSLGPALANTRRGIVRDWHPRFRIQPDSFGHHLTYRKMSSGSDCSSRPATADCREHQATGRKIDARFGLLLGPGPPMS